MSTEGAILSDTTWINTGLSKRSFKSSESQLFELDKTSSYWITQGSNGFRSFANKCGHMGAKVSCSNSLFICPLHNWKFDLNGKNLNEGQDGLTEVPVRVNASGEIEIKIRINRGSKETSIQAKGSTAPKMFVHSHACIELQFDEKSILTDPWLVSPAYFGSWHLFPKPLVAPEDLSPDAILITHPHPDHFHPETLSRFNRDIPIYFPKFQSRFIDRTLESLGFSNMRPTFFGEEVLITENLKFKFLQPHSFWEDSSIFVTAGHWTWLNQNDAGSILDDSQIPLEIDLLSTSFDQGSSGYPLTWGNIREETKPKLMELAKTKTLQLLPSRADQVSAKYFLPFAGHWRLGLTDHQKFSKMIPHTNLLEVTKAFSKFGSTCKVLELLPGDSFDFNSLEQVSNPESHNEYQSGFVDVVDHEVKDNFDFNFCKFKSSIENLALTSKSMRCESVMFGIEIEGYPEKIEVHFGEKDDSPINVKVSVPKFIAFLLSEELTTWDHVAIGYWGKWSRNPDVYTPNFLRLLHIGYQSEFQHSESSSNNQNILNQSIAHLLEHEPDLVAAVLTRAGLPCVACSKVNLESLENAFNFHSINLDWQARVVAELNALGSNRSNPKPS